MPLAKKLIICLFSFIFIFNLFSGCIFEEIFGPSFTLKTWEVSDYEGFPCFNITFSCTGTVTVKILSNDNTILDSDFFFVGDHNASLNLAEYRTSVKPGKYNLVVYDNKDSKIHTESFNFQGEVLKIISCNQKWWNKDPWLGDYALLGLELFVANFGDTPAYPNNIDYILDSKENNSLVLPSVILPGDKKYLKCFVYEDTTEGEKTLSVTLNNINNEEIATETFDVEVKENVPLVEFDWHYLGNRRRSVPKSEYLLDYYKSLERIVTEDYSLFVFDLLDNKYIDVLLDCILFGFSSENDVERINYVASMVQSIEYTSDSETNSSYEYPRYPVETLFDKQGDCEDKSILTAAFLYNMGFEVVLFRLPNHMAVGVKLPEDAIPKYDFYVEDYYFLETTTSGNPCGFIPLESRKSISDLTIHTISNRPLLIHNWADDKIAIFTNTEMGDFVKVTIFIENIGINTAYNSKVTAGFFSDDEIIINSESNIIFLEPGSKKKMILSVDIPKNEITWFKTKVYLNGEIVEDKQSVSTFPL